MSFLGKSPYFAFPGIDQRKSTNAAEKEIRPAVLWRKNSFGSQSEEGS